MTSTDPNNSELSAPDCLLEGVEAWFEAADPVIHEVLRAAPNCVADLKRVVACSSYVADTLARYPELLAELVGGGRLAAPLGPDELVHQFESELPVDLAEAEFERHIRRLRHRELVRIAWRDLTGVAPVEEALKELSELADAAICAAVRWASAALSARYGCPRNEAGEPADFGVLGMGKLGGGELNFSSDIDLVFVYSESGQTDGSRSVSNEEFFRSLARRLVALLSKNTSDGFVYRVDVRLRPFGDSGPLAVSLPALEAYLLQHGRDWERYAYVKARVVNAWSESDALYEQILRPFVYRRYLDYGVFASLREMKAMIEAEVGRREFRDNIKLGPGGIREIEFIVQSLQLVRGGTVGELRRRELLDVLPSLAQHDCLPGSVAAELRDAYWYLRRVENRLQAIADRQTHDLPEDEINRARLMLAMGYSDWASLAAELNRHRAIVSGHFRNIVFRGPDESAAGNDSSALPAVWSDGATESSMSEGLAALGFADAERSAATLRAMRESSAYRRIDEIGRQRLDTLMPALIAVAAAHDRPDDALESTLSVIESIGRRSAYFALLNENPQALSRLVNLCAMSDFLARQLAAHPLLLDELLDQRVFLEPPQRAELKAELDGRMETVDEGDIEQSLDALRHFQQAAMFRVAVADLSGILPLMKVSDRLTDIAELILQASIDMAWPELTRQYGEPFCKLPEGPRDAQFAIIAYGKLGGLELGYGSDLDLVFMNDSEGEDQSTNGDRSVDNAVFFSRLTRRIIHTLTIPTGAGRLYEVDTRLRPSGQSGLLVSTLAAFERYQRHDAWTWEHQALLRSRAVAGHPRVMAAFESLRTHVLTHFVRRESLRDDVADMRHRMREELGRGTTDVFDIKQDRGGIADIEFTVQYLVLREAIAHPELVRWSDNIRQLDALASLDILPSDHAATLADIYRDYRQRVHRLALAGESGLVPRDEFATSAAQVADIWDEVFG